MVDNFEAGNMYRREFYGKTVSVSYQDYFIVGVLKGSATDHVTLSTLRVDQEGQTSLPEEINVFKSEFKNWTLL